MTTQCMLAAVNEAAPVDQMTVLRALERFFAEHSPAQAVAPLPEDMPLLGSGLLDSLSMLQLTMFLSDEFGVEFADDDFTVENFGTARDLTRLVANKAAAVA